MESRSKALVKRELNNAQDSDEEASEMNPSISSVKRQKFSPYRPEDDVKSEAVYLTFYLNAKLTDSGGASLLLENKLNDRLIFQKEVKEEIPLKLSSGAKL